MLREVPDSSLKLPILTSGNPVPSPAIVSTHSYDS